MKRVALFYFVAILAGATVGCGHKANTADQTGAGAKRIIVGFAQTGAESSWRTAETESIKSEAERRNITLKFADGQGQQENQIKAIRAFIAQGVDVIVLAPLVDTGWEPVLQEAKQAGIPVVLVSRGIQVEDDSLYVTLISSDFVSEGRMAADWLIKKSNGRANIIELVGTTGSDCARDRQQGFAAEIKDQPGLKIVDSQSGDFRRSGGKEVMEALLKKHADKINAVYAHNDDMALGAIQAIDEAGLKPGEDVLVVSIDGVHDAFQAMVDGKLNCSVECPPLHGPAVFDAVEKIVAGGAQLPKHIVVEDQVFDQSIAKDWIDRRKY
jgi:ABC-type sugar transport system substrate-binding protein